MTKDKSEFTEQELDEARTRIDGERESSLIVPRRQRLANAAGMGDVGPDPTTPTTTVGSAGAATGTTRGGRR